MFVLGSRLHTNPYKVGTYLTQKEDFLFYLLMFVFRTPHHRYAEPLLWEKPQWVCAFSKQKEGKFNLPLDVCICNGRRNASPTGISGNFSQPCRDRRPRLSFMNACICNLQLLRSKNFTHEVNFTRGANFTLTKSKFHCKMTCRFAVCLYL